MGQRCKLQAIHAEHSVFKRPCPLDHVNAITPIGMQSPLPHHLFCEASALDRCWCLAKAEDASEGFLLTIAWTVIALSAQRLLRMHPQQCRCSLPLGRGRTAFPSAKLETKPCTYTAMYGYISYLSITLHTYVCIYIYICISIFLFVCLYMCVCVCMYVYIYIYTYTYIYMYGDRVAVGVHFFVLCA